MMTKYVYDFSEGGMDQKDLLGGKGANLAEMANLGLPVPPGFTISTDACRAFLAEGKEPVGLADEVSEHLETLEKARGKTLGDPQDPLLVSVRSGAKFSMPGMMETVLNVGLTDESVKGLAKVAGGDVRFAYDSYRRLLQMFGSTVLGIDESVFSEALDTLKAERGSEDDLDLTAEDLQGLVDTYKGLISEHSGRDFSQDPREQLDMAVLAVFDSWNTERATIYRRQERIPDDLGTAVNICSMVFGNGGDESPVRHDGCLAIPGHSGGVAGGPDGRRRRRAPGAPSPSRRSGRRRRPVGWRRPHGLCRRWHLRPDRGAGRRRAAADLQLDA